MGKKYDIFNEILIPEKLLWYKRILKKQQLTFVGKNCNSAVSQYLGIDYFSIAAHPEVFYS